VKSNDKSNYINGPKWHETGNFEVPKPKDTLRVCIFGDSLSEETWPPMLSKLINDNTNIKT